MNETSRWNVKLLVVVAATLAWICAASAQSTVDLVANPVSPIAVKLGVDALRYEIRLRNPSDQGKIARTGPFLTRAEDGLTVQPSTNPSAGSVSAKGELSVTVSASLPLPGTYETWLEIADERTPERAENRIPITVMRAVEPVVSTLLAGAKPQQLVWWPWGNEFLAWLSPDRSTLLPVTNAGTKPVTFDPPVMLGFHKLEGEAELSTFSTEAMRLSPDGCPSPLPAGRSCALAFTMRKTLAPGSYLVEYGTGGPGGGWSKGEFRISVRASAWIAFALVFAGVWAGAYVDGWRKGGREALDALILLKRAAGRLAGLGGSRDLGPSRAALVQEIEALEARVDAGQPDQAANDAVLKRVDRFCGAWALSVAFQELEPSGAAVIGPRYRAVRDALLRKALTPEELEHAEKKVRSLSGDLALWPRAAAVLKRAKGIPAALNRLSTAMGEDVPEDAERASSAIATALAELEKPLSDSADGTIEERLSQVDQAERLVEALIDTSRSMLRDRCRALQDADKPILERLDRWEATTRLPGDAARITSLAELWTDARAPKPALPPGATASLALPDRGTIVSQTVPSSTAAAAPSSSQGGSPQLVVAFGSSSQSLQELEKRRKEAEFRSNLIIATSTALASIVVLANSATWGSWNELITAFMAGVGSRIVFTALTDRPQR